MPRYFLSLAYDGSAYHGWQIQPNATSVQEEIETALSKLHGNIPIEIVGCGRTDAGVHAQQYFLHTDLPLIWEPQQLVFKLNRMTPPAIAFFEAWQTAPDLHARFDASKRTYRYFIHHQKNPFKNDTSWYQQSSLDIAAMNDAAKYLLGQQDFGSFAKLHTDVKTNICEVFAAQWHVTDNGIYFEITANRFLRNMVRAIVGTLVEVGLGKIEASTLPDIIAAKDRGEAFISAPAQGLFLWKITYDKAPELS
ncbi:MAG: tRNA pseudouridine(38-40) synthase TruA [Flavobacteriales bacterium]